MKRQISFFIGLVFTCSASAQDISFDLSAVPDSVRKGADVIKRTEDIFFEVTDVDRARLTVRQVYAVLNKEGMKLVTFHEYANKHRTLDDVEIKIYEASGRQVSKYKKKDIYKQADLSGLTDDLMHYYQELGAPSFPAFVVLNYQVSYSGTLQYPSYDIAGPKEAVEASAFTAKIPADLGLRYKNQECKISPQITREGNATLYKWAVKNVTPVKYEEQSVVGYRYFPSVLLAPNRFKLYNTQGDLSSWKKFGEWELNLIQGLDQLPEERKQFFADLVKHAPTEADKIDIIYNYLQKNFRYVSIQLGIGGYKPFPAKFTDEKKYGDCKGLSFYTYSILKSLGIKSYVALINAGHNLPPVDPDFPMNEFNHMILCVPQQKDTIWLECTSQTSDFNFLGAFTENKNALLITENGGVLVPTPVSKSIKNTFSFITEVKLTPEGSGETVTRLNSRGDMKERITAVIADKKDNQKEYIVYNLGFKQPDEFTLIRNNNEEIVMNLLIEKVPEFSAGSKMFLSPRIYKLLSAVLPNEKDRLHDFYFRSVLEHSDTTAYTLPEGYTTDALPKGKQINNEFVSYITNYWVNESNNQLFTSMRFCIKKNKVPASQYEMVKKTFDEIIIESTQKLIIKKS